MPDDKTGHIKPDLCSQSALSTASMKKQQIYKQRVKEHIESSPYIKKMENIFWE